LVLDFYSGKSLSFGFPDRYKGIHLTGIIMAVEGDELALPTGMVSRCHLVEASRRLGRYAHFRSTPMALLTLLRVMSGDAWIAIYLQVTIDLL
jgi:hypothetical protein